MLFFFFLGPCFCIFSLSFCSNGLNYINSEVKLHITRNLKREEMLDYIEMKFEVCKHLQEVERN